MVIESISKENCNNQQVKVYNKVIVCQMLDNVDVRPLKGYIRKNKKGVS